MNIVRWILTPFCVPAGLFVAICVGSLLMAGRDGLVRAFALENSTALGMESVLLILIAAVAAALVVWLPGKMAPGCKRQVKIAAFITGGGYALFIAMTSGRWPEFVAAVVAGLLVVLFPARRTPVRMARQK